MRGKPESADVEKQQPAPVSPNGLDPDAEPQEEKRKFKLSDYKYRSSSGGLALRQRLKIPEGKPGADVFFRIDPRPEMKEEVNLLEYRPVQDASAETYPVLGDLAGAIPRIKPAVIRICICRPNIVRVWALKAPNAEGRSVNGYTQTAWDAAETAEKRWVRMEVNQSRTGYDILIAETSWPDPEWPSESLDELVEKAFGDRFITDLDHEILAKLRGKE